MISLFIILLVLIQRGRGGGLAGAFGGMGGQSAFGTRAGDTFTRVTIVVAVIWVLLAGGLGIAMRSLAAAKATGTDSQFKGGASVETPDGGKDDGSAPVKTADEKPDGDKETPPAAPADATNESGDKGAAAAEPQSATPAVPAAPAASETPAAPAAETPEASSKPAEGSPGDSAAPAAAETSSESTPPAAESK